MKQKVIPIIYLILVFISTSILIALCYKMNNLFAEGSLQFNDLDQKYNSLQKTTNLLSIISFVILLLVGFANFYVNQNMKYIIWSNLLYIPVTLFNYVTLNHKFYEAQGIVPTENSGFWLILFIGIFYIIGAVLTSIIGTFTIRNLNKRLKYND